MDSPPLAGIPACIVAFLCAGCGFWTDAAAASEQTVVIANPLGLAWPWELVHHDFPAGTFANDVSALVGGESRPAQLEALPDGRQRVWFIATLTPDGKHKTDPLTVTLRAGAATSPLALQPDGEAYVIGNGVYRCKVPLFTGAFPAKKMLNQVPTALGGCQVEGDSAWFGRSWFVGDAPITGARTEVLARGPIFISVRVRYQGEAQASDGGEAGSSLKDHGGAFYEITLRFVSGDPWIEIDERYDLPGANACWLEWKDGLKPDTAMWIRWFGYEAFGGNVDLHFAPLEPQKMQRGPFVALRPVWNQMPGGGQDFFVTRGGEKPTEAQAPAVGVVAIHASRWRNPFAQTIGCLAEHGDTATVKFPLNSGARTYALVVGARARFDSTGKLNDLVRRHADWTLDKQLNDCVLEWAREPALAGPHILMTRDDLKRLQGDYKNNKDTPEMSVLKEFVAKKDSLGGLDRDLINLIIGEKAPKPNLPSPDLWLQRRYQDDFLNPTGFTRAIKKGWPTADLFGAGEPLGGAPQAAIGYIFSDLDQWPGYTNGWSPGNPNFHTDKYTIAVFAAAAMLDHPDAKNWLAYGKANFDEDSRKVLLPPDGVGYESPGYSSYSLRLQMDLAKVFMNTGYGNPIVENPLYRKTGFWHRSLLTPFDRRLGIRHQAPIGDTHRWGNDEGEMFGTLAKFFKRADPAFAGEMMGVWKLYRDQGMRGTVLSDLIDVDQSIAPQALERMDWGSHAFAGFGAILRSRFAAEAAGSRETFATFRCGAAVGHAHNEQLSYHFYGAGTPISLDYNCSYHPRGDHAALHNSMTFGVTKSFTHQGEDHAVEAMEQLEGIGVFAAFASTPAADASVGEIASDRLTLSPIYPEDARFQYAYPTRSVARIVHRRFLVLVKHPPGSRLEDYLVIRDETTSSEPQQNNIHLLARGVTQDGNLIHAEGQLDADITVFLASANAPQVSVGRWFYFDEWMNGPGKFKSTGKGVERAKAAQSEAENAAWIAGIHDSDGQTLIPPKGWSGLWTVGEYQKWIRVKTTPGTPLLWVLYARKTGAPEPVFTSLANGGVRVALDQEIDEILAATAPSVEGSGQVVVRHNGVETVVLAPGALPALGALSAKTSP